MAQDNERWKIGAPVDSSTGEGRWKSGSPVEEEPPARGFKGWAQDIGATALKGAIGVPEALVGLADIPTGGAVGKFLENEGGVVGFRPKQAKEIASDWNSDATKQAQQKFQAAEGIGGKLQAAIENPSIIATSIGESLPAMGAGGVAARGLLGATRLGAMGAKGAAIAGAAGEGAMMAGQQAEAIRQETPDGLLTPEQSALAAGTGLIGGVVGAASGRLANKLGIGDVDTMVAQGANGIAAPAAQGALKSIPKKVIQGAMTEGLLEELPQSVAEQVLQNLALGKDWSEGVDDAIVLGTLSGGAMGGGAAGFKGYMDSRTTPEQAPAQPQEQPPADQSQPMGASLTGTAPADLMARGTDPLAGQIADARVLADDTAVTRNDFAERNGEALAGGGMFGSRADPLANMLADQRTSDANTSVNIQRAAEKRPPMPATAAANILVASQQQGLDFTVAPHPDGGYLVIPRAWVTPQVAKQAEASLRETLGRVAQVEDAPVQRAARISTDPAALDLNTDAVVGYVDNLRAVNTPAAKAFVGEFDAGRITRQDVEQRMAVERGKTADERLAEAAAQARAPQDPYSLPAIRPSQAMGLNPAAGPMSSAAVIAVDSGAYNSVRAAQITTGEPTNGTTPAQAVKTAPQGQEVQPGPGDSRSGGSVAQGGRTGSEIVPSSEQQPATSLKAPRGILAKKAEADAARAARNLNGQTIQPTREASTDAGAVAPPAVRSAGVSGVDEQGAVPALSDEWQQFPEQTGTLNVPRAEMPQVKNAHRGPMVNFLNARGVTHEQVEVDPATLKPTQAEFSQTKVQEAADRDTDRSILISADGYVIDGHHQAIAKLQNGKPVRAIRLNATAEELIPMVREFPSSTTEQANVQNTQSRPAGAEAQAAPVEAPAPARGDAATTGAVSAKAGAGDIQTDGVKPRGVLAKLADQKAKKQAAMGPAMRAALESVGLDPDAPVDRAAKLRRDADKLATEARKMLDGIVPGQPVMSVRDRNLRDRSGDKMRKAGEMLAEADRLDDGKAKTATPAEPVKPAEDDAKPAQKAAEKIEDFGEKLAGARKDYAATLKDAMSVDVAAEPLSKSWPEPDYQKLLDGGADPFMVAWVHAARDEIPTKPQTSWKLSGWVKSVNLLRKVSSEMLSGEITKERLQEMLEKPEYSSLKRQFGGRAELYQAVGHGKSLKGITFMEHHYSMYRDEKNVTKWAVEMKAKSSSFGGWPREIAVADTKADALAQFKAKYEGLDAGSKGKGSASFVIYRKRGEPGAFIGKKIGREYIDLHKAEDVKAARAYLADNTDKLEKALERYKDTPYERGEENAPRVGDDHRNGAPVTPEVFGQTFGFRGVQFGNYVEQGRRQSDLNEAFDALMDMAAVLGIPPKAISLNGRLGLAFGARGKGGKNAPAAHYEAGNVVINLTKGGGPGSLAHEWFHAMDNYFAKQGGGAGYMTDGADGATLREEMRQAFKAVKTAVNTGALKLRSLELDKRRTKPYWSTPIEMAARSFESYVVAKLQDQNASNDYLANVVNDKVWEISEAARAEFFTGKQASPSYPYPTVDELPVLRAAFDDFFKVVQTRETESGSVELFNQRRGEDAPTEESAAVQSAIEGKSLVEAAQFVADTGSAAQREVAAMVVKKLQAMQEAGVNLELKVAHRGEQVPQDLIFSRGYTEIGMDAKGRDVVVWLNGADVKSKVGTDYETLLHELVHAATAGAMRHAAFVKDSPYGDALKSLDAAAQAIGDHITGRFEQADAGDIELTEFEQDIRAQANNAFTSLDEVVSWALTSREAQEYLDGIPYKSGSLWTRFVRAVRSALGLSEESDTVLSEVLRAAEKLMNPQDEGTRFMRALWHKRGIMAGTQQAKGSVVFINRNFARGPATESTPGNSDANYGAKDQAQGTPTDRAVMDMAGEGKSADEILRFIAGASKSPFNRQMANLLRRTKANPAVSIGGEMGGGAGFKFLAKYSRQNHEVTLSEGASGKAEQILLHEMVHAATLLALDRGGEHAARMKALYESVKAQGLSDAYGMKNVGEFVAEAFTNPEFQKALKGYKAPGGTAWDRFVAAVRRILGLSDNSQDALSAALELGVEVMRENVPLRAAKSFRAEDAPAFAGSMKPMPENQAPGPQGDAQQGANKGNAVTQDRPSMFGKFPVLEKSLADFEADPDSFVEWLVDAVGDDLTKYAKDGELVAVGLRSTPSKEELGKHPRHSTQTEGGGQRDTAKHYKLPATSTIGITADWDYVGYDVLVDASKYAFKEIKKYARLGTGYIAVVAGRHSPANRKGVALDDGETLIERPKVIAYIRAFENDQSAPDTDGADAYFGMADAASLKNSALEQIHNTLSHPGKVSVWDKTIGTMRNLAERSKEFKPVFDAAQRFIDDVSMLGNEAADAAPRLLPRVESWRDLTKKPVSAEDNKAISKPIFEGTLMWARDTDGKPVLVDDMAKKYADLSAEKKSKMLMAAGRLDDRVLRMWQGLPSDQFDALVNSRFESQMLKAGVVWKDAELKSLFNLSDNQISLYREARQAIDRSIDLTARADMLRAVGTGYASMRDAVLELPTLADARDLLVETLHADALDNEDQADRLSGMINTIADRFEKATELSASGYAPLSRFGRYTLDVVDASGERQYFGLYESMRDANLAKVQMAGAFPGSTITQGTMSAEAYKLFAGITPESLELFGNMLGLDAEGGDARDKAFQEYLKLSKNNHSALKRLMHRKGIAGYSEDVGRVLASFVYSNARQAAGGLNAGTIEEAVNAIPKDQGELKDVAMGLRDYVRDPQEEGQAIRGMLFAQYLGGSVASAFVNMTQPVAVTLPWLSQYGGMKMAGQHLAKAFKDMAGNGAYESDLKTALDRAEEDGVVSPQEIHQLMAQARGAGGLRSGDGTRSGNARAAASNAWERTKVAWGQPFALAEQFNRRSTFIAAYRMAKERGMQRPDQFARRAVLETQFLYSRANKPRWARGVIGGTLFTFKTYSVSYLELLNRMANTGKPGSPERAAGRRAVAWAMVTLMLMGGAGGLPFVEDLEDLIDGIAQLLGYNVSSKQLRKQAIEDVVGKEIGEFVNSGLSGLPGAPIDVSGRLGMGDLIPGTGLLLSKQNRERDLLEVVGPAGDLVTRGFTGARKALSGDIGGAALELSPTAVRNAAKGIDMAITDRYTDAKGYKVLDTTLPEAAAKFIGFQPRSVAKIQEANSFMMRSKAFYTQTSAEIKAQWARALFEKDDAALRDVRKRLADWNSNNPDQPIVVKMPDVWKRVREMGKDRTERIADTAPKALRQEMRELARDS